ncbi:MAG: putative lipid II flippase FtsW [Oscillospiraceae bacterium]|nr:putative lipid II flippase FtsW [Oscillospiraceae bacterium]
MRPANALTPFPEGKKKKIKFFSLVGGFDMPIFILLMILLAIGLICLYSASYVYGLYYEGGDSFYFIKRQLLWAVIGIALMLIISTIDYRILRKFAWPLMGLALILLVVTLLLPAASGVQRWIRIPGIPQFQPSEIAKFALILLFAHLISKDYKRMKTFTRGYLPFIVILCVVCGLILIEPHLSGTMLVLAVGLILMYVGGTRGYYLLLTLGLGAAAVVVAVFLLGYERQRIDVWLHPLTVYASGTSGRDLAWQTVQSLYAIGSGGLMGVGLGNSREKQLFLPEPQNDFIFAIVCEELGFIGAVVILVLFGLLVWRGIVIAMKAPDKFGFLLAIGLAAQIGIQVALNVAVVTNAFPNTGISLPFFSYGGTSMLMLLAQMGVLLSISRQARLEKT